MKHIKDFRGDIAREIARSTQEQGGLITVDDLKNYEVYIEEPLKYLIKILTSINSQHGFRARSYSISI